MFMKLLFPVYGFSFRLPLFSRYENEKPIFLWFDNSRLKWRWGSNYIRQWFRGIGTDC
jgi:hypothetical protein